DDPNKVPMELCTTYQDTTWFPWLFRNFQCNVWENLENHKLYFDWLSEKLEINCQYDWYRVQMSDIWRNYGTNLLKCYGNSLLRALQCNVNGSTWFPWLFSKISSDYWEIIANRRQFMDWLSSKLHIYDEYQWY